ncbi:MAG: hypothetical protein KIT09_17820 [Bryobacteraceae bacterium]|nr:hypothetical protein [Bryobacteraceae bacterium]
MDDVRNLWQKQEVEEVKFPVDVLRVKAGKFERRIRWRNLREQAACLLVITAFGAMSFKITQTVPRISFALIIAGAIYVAWHIQKWGSPRALAADLGRANCVGFYRDELERQRNLLRSIWKWYLGPLVPGLSLLVLYGIWVAAPERRWFPVAYAVAAAAFFWLIGWLNQRAARQLDGQIAELDRELHSA